MASYWRGEYGVGPFQVRLFYFNEERTRVPGFPAPYEKKQNEHTSYKNVTYCSPPPPLLHVISDPSLINKKRRRKKDSQYNGPVLET